MLMILVAVSDMLGIFPSAALSEAGRELVKDTSSPSVFMNILNLMGVSAMIYNISVWMSKNTSIKI